MTPTCTHEMARERRLELLWIESAHDDCVLLASRDLAVV